MPFINQRKLAALSRDSGFLVKTCIFIVILALMISATVSSLFPKKQAIDFSKSKLDSKIVPDLNADALASLIRNRNFAFIESAPRDFQDLGIFHSDDYTESSDYEILKRRTIGSTAINEGFRERLLLLLDALHCTDSRRTDAIAKLQRLPDDKRYRNEFLGDALLTVNKHEEAITAYRLEGEKFPEAHYSQRSTVIAYTKRRDSKELQQVLANRNFRKPLNSFESFNTFKITGDYKRLLVDTFKYKLEIMNPLSLPAAIFTAAIWFIVLTNMASFSGRKICLGLIAFLLGMLSTVFTIYIVEVQNHHHILEFHPEDTLLNQLLSMIAGIGLREETLKLICYAPIAFTIARYRDPVLALVTAALTGLGFAMSENLAYFAVQADGFSIWHRLLSANVMHFCLTGIVGYSLYTLIVNRGRRWENFLLDFLLVVFLHGAYDGFIMIPALAEYGQLITLIILVLLAYRFLDLVRDHMPTEGQLRRISPLAVFVVGTALLACAIMVLTAITTDFAEAVKAFASAVGGSILVAFAFISRLRDL